MSKQPWHWTRARPAARAFSRGSRSWALETILGRTDAGGGGAACAGLFGVLEERGFGADLGRDGRGEGGAVLGVGAAGAGGLGEQGHACVSVRLLFRPQSAGGR